MAQYIILAEDDVDHAAFTDIDDYDGYKELLDACDYLERFESLEYAFERYPKMMGVQRPERGQIRRPSRFLI